MLYKKFITNQNKYRPAHCAALSGNVELLQALRLKRGNLWLASYVTGNYVLHEAAIAGYIDTHKGI